MAVFLGDLAIKGVILARLTGSAIPNQRYAH
jgi:hypothetical protein